MTNQTTTITNLEELSGIFSTIVDPGGQDEYLIEEIHKWCVKNNYNKQEVFEALVDQAKTSLNNDEERLKKFACVLGLFYHYGIGTPHRKKKAFKWYTRAANSGDPFGMNQLGWCYSIPFGTDQDYEKSIHWTKKSAFLGNPSGACNLANAYQHGTKIGKNDVKSFLWYKYAANAGVLNAQINMACCYRVGLGTFKNMHEALRWYRIASKHPKNTRNIMNLIFAWRWLR
ncbi:9494_t:CDS:1 [Ambispora leptoticha]|uniref:9494_t:CDS:1 n=1 Tax=Ambispora leptoticha TaxID=144679 RepID=A0A9N9DWX2_9GLOM|nr:9494_t:CDS:1 [Ambispora leptoticha]